MSFSACRWPAGRGVARRRRIGAALDEQHRHEHVRDVGLVDRHRDRLLRRGQRELAMRPDAFALGRHERRRLLPRRLDHDPRGVARLVGLALGHELDAVVIEARPRGVAVAERVERRRASRRSGRRPRRRAPRGRSSRRSATGCRAAPGRARRRHRPGPGRHFLALGVPGVEAVAFGAADARPLDLRQRDRRPARRRRPCRPGATATISVFRPVFCSTKYGGRRRPMYHGAGCTVTLARLAMCWRETSSTSPSSV